MMQVNFSKHALWIHSVYFWLQRDKSDHELPAFLQALESLKEIPPVKQLWVGTPAPTDRPAVDSTYDAALTVFFEDAQGHALYQKHLLHQNFLENYRAWWRKVVIYDFQSP